MPEQQQPRISLLSLDKIVRPLLILVIVGVVGNLAFCLWTTDRQKLAELLHFDGRYLLLAMLLTLVPLLGHTVRTIMWTRFLGYRLGLAKLFRIVLATELAASITPTAIGGGPLKIAMLIQTRVRTGAAACVATLPTLEDLLFFIVAVPVAMTISSSWHHPVFNLISEGIDLHWALPCLIGGVIGGGGLALLCRKSGFRIRRWERLQEQLKTTGVDFLNVCRTIGGTGKSRLLLSVIIAGIQWTCRNAVAAMLVTSLGVEVEFIQFLVLQWLIFILTLFIPTPGATGGSEALFYLIFKPLLPNEILAVTVGGWRFLTFYWVMIIYAILLYILLNFRRSKTEPI
ncbi:hypothetical protein C6502_07955 [Candidatus Poribacteria bacterium]|nr:MAG: hypothetical protein C6502_07955 [Candidatus Poribacteria bacterium]